MTRKLLARILLLAGVVIICGLFAWEACAEELSIVEVKSNIPLSEQDPVYHDYYINSGTGQGLKHNLVVRVVRKITVKDSTGTQTYGDMMVPVGKLKIIMAGEKFAVARELKLISHDEEPMLEQTGIMIGDKIELNGSYVDNHKLPSPISAAQVQMKLEADAAKAALAKETPKVEKPVEKPAETAVAKTETPAKAETLAEKKPEAKVEAKAEPAVATPEEALPEQKPVSLPTGEKTATADDNTSI